MRSRIGPMILASGGLAAACLIFGFGDGQACPAGMAPAACVVGSVEWIQDLFILFAATGAIVGGLLVVSVLWQVRRHRQLAKWLNQSSLRARVADHEVRFVPGLQVPCVAGLARPRIYCPPDVADRLSDLELQAVVLHERHHQLAHAPARLVVLEALAPALERLDIGRRWAERRRAAIEIAADDHALETGARPAALAGALLKLGSANLHPVLPSYASATELRLRHLMGDATPGGRGLGWLVPLVMPIGALALCITSGPIT